MNAMTRILPWLGCLLFGASAVASPITYTFSGTATGTLGTTPFTNAPITVNAVGDTATVTNGGVLCNSLSSVTFTIGGVGSGTITDLIGIFDNQGNSAVGLQRGVCGGADVMDIFAPAFASYNLTSPMGTVTGTAIANSQGPVNTTAGALTLTDSTGLTAFSATGGVISPPVIDVTPSSLTFPDRTINTTSPVQTITVTNRGPGTAAIRSVTIAGDYGFTSRCPATLAVNATCTIDVTFTPIATGARRGTLTITSNASSNPNTVPLSGNGTPVPVGTLQAAPTLVTFDPQHVGDTSPPQTLTLTNTGSATLRLGPASVDGDFRIVTGCVAPIEPAASCQVALVFAPTAVGDRVGAVTFPNDGSTPVVTVRLAGTGLAAVPPRALSVLPGALAFADQRVGTPSNGKTVTITNNSAASVAITDLNASPADFTVSDTCTTLAPRAACSAVVTFQPTAVGPRAGSLTIRTASESTPYFVSLAGQGLFNGIPQLHLSATRIGFGNALLGSAPANSVVLTNIGLVPVIIGSITASGSFFVSSHCGTTLDPGNSCSVDIAFVPFAVGVSAGVLEIRDNAANNPQLVDLAGNGCAIPSFFRNRIGAALCGN